MNIFPKIIRIPYIVPAVETLRINFIENKSIITGKCKGKFFYITFALSAADNRNKIYQPDLVVLGRQP